MCNLSRNAGARLNCVPVHGQDMQEASAAGYCRQARLSKPAVFQCWSLHMDPADMDARQCVLEQGITPGLSFVSEGPLYWLLQVAHLHPKAQSLTFTCLACTCCANTCDWSSPCDLCGRAMPSTNSIAAESGNVVPVCCCLSAGGGSSLDSTAAPNRVPASSCLLSAGNCCGSGQPCYRTTQC